MCKINVVSSSIYLVLVKIDNMYCKHYYRIHLYVLLVYNQAFLKAYLVMYRAKSIKFIYSEKATKFCEIFPLLLTTVRTVKSKGKFSQNFVTFSEYMKFKILRQKVDQEAFTKVKSRTNILFFDLLTLEKI